MSDGGTRWVTMSSIQSKSWARVLLYAERMLRHYQNSARASSMVTRNDAGTKGDKESRCGCLASRASYMQDY